MADLDYGNQPTVHKASRNEALVIGISASSTVDKHQAKLHN